MCLSELLADDSHRINVQTREGKGLELLVGVVVVALAVSKAAVFVLGGVVAGEDIGASVVFAETLPYTGSGFPRLVGAGSAV
jgi:hypothetical protein